MLTGKLLTAVFKDYLIYDDIFEFVQCYWNTTDSQKYISKYAKYQRQIAVVKYGYRKGPAAVGGEKEVSWKYNDLVSENIVNRPNSIMMTKEIQKLLAYNIKMKYFTRYEKRLAE